MSAVPSFSKGDPRMSPPSSIGDPHASSSPKSPPLVPFTQSPPLLPSGLLTNLPNTQSPIHGHGPASPPATIHTASQEDLLRLARLKVHEADAEAMAEARRNILALGGDGSSPVSTSSPKPFEHHTPPSPGDYTSTPLPPLPSPLPQHSGLPPYIPPPILTNIPRAPSSALRRRDPSLSVDLPSSSVKSGWQFADGARRSPLSQSVTFLDQQEELSNSFITDGSSNTSRSTSQQPTGDKVPRSQSHGDLVHHSNRRGGNNNPTHPFVPTRESSIPRDLNLSAQSSASEAGENGASQLARRAVSFGTPGPSRMGRAYSEGSVQRGEEAPDGNGRENQNEGMSDEGMSGLSPGSGVAGAARSIGSERNDQSTSPKYVLAVIGSPTCGKTTLIRKAFKGYPLSDPIILREERGRPRISLFSTLVNTSDPSRLGKVDIYEIDLRALWVPPDATNNKQDLYEYPSFLPKFDGLIACYDSQAETSLFGLDHAVRDLHLNRQAVIVACKSDPDILDPAVGPHQGMKLGVDSGIGLVQVSNRSRQGKQKMKRSFEWMLKAISKDRHAYAKYLKAQQQLQAEYIPQSPVEGNVSNGPSAPSTDGYYVPSPGGPVSDLIPEPLASRLPSGSDSPAPIRPGHRSQLSPSSSEGSLQQMGMSATVVRNPNVVPAPAPAQAPRKSSETMEDSGVAIPVMVDSSPQDQPSVKEPANVKPVLTVQIPGAQNAFIPGEAGPSKPAALLSELLSKLMRAVLSGNESSFVNTFFLVYRRFCQPSMVMNEILAKWQEVSSMYGLTPQYRLLCQINLVQVVSEWLQTYPGDFSSATSRTGCENLLERALKEPGLAYVTSVLAEAYIEAADKPDMDQSWSYRDLSILGEPIAGLRPDSRATADDGSVGVASASYSELDDGTQEAIAASRIATDLADTPTATSESYILATPDPSLSQQDLLLRYTKTEGSGTGSGAYSSLSLQRTQSDASKQSRRSSEGSLSKKELSQAEERQLARSLELFERQPEIGIAIELTKLQWKLFNEIRPRDCLRAVLGEEIDTPIATAADHYNVLAAVVATMVLGHVKPKQRAKVFEKWVSVAKHLRHMNDYPSLQAVCTGLGDTSVRRMSQTRSYLRPGCQQELQGYLDLLSVEASFQRYRNLLKGDAAAGSSAIPLISIVKTDIVKAQMGSRGKSDTINWAALSVMADAVSPVALYQSRPSPVAGKPGSEMARQAFMGSPSLNDDALYRRSRILEPSNEVPTARFKRLMHRVDESLGYSNSHVPILAPANSAGML